MGKVAVVGTGIGGCAAAYFANKYLPDIKVTLYDAQKRVGGRILTQKPYNTSVELGAEFFNGSNKTILELVTCQQLKVEQAKEFRNFGIWNGSELVFRSSNYSAQTNLKLLEKYQRSILRIISLLREAKHAVAKLYRQEQKNPKEMNHLFEAAGISQWFPQTLAEILLENGVSQTFIDEVAEPITRTIYSQNADLGGFAGLVSLIGVYGAPIYRFVGGNSMFPAQLAASSKAEIKSEREVTNVEKTGSGTYRISCGREVMEGFNGVIVAAPLDLAGIEFDGVTLPRTEPQHYQTVYTKIMRGTIDPTYFGLTNKEKPPNIMLTTKEADPIKHCSIQTIKNEEWVKFTSTKPIGEEAFSGVFKGCGVPVLEHHWEAAYPVFQPLEELPPTRLDERMFYVNAVEAAVSSMETAVLSALNSVKLMRAVLG